MLSAADHKLEMVTACARKPPLSVSPSGCVAPSNVMLPLPRNACVEVRSAC